MTPWKDVVIVSPETPVNQAVRLMAEHRVDRAAVVRGDRLVGFIDRAAILRRVELSRSRLADGGRGFPTKTGRARGRRGPREADRCSAASIRIGRSLTQLEDDDRQVVAQVTVRNGARAR
jgi:hypothetical protein